MKLKNKKNILSPPIGLKSVAGFEKNLEFMVFVYITNEWEEKQVSYLNSAIEKEKMTSEEICKWCIAHNINWQVIYSVTLITIIKNPYRYFRYRKLNKLDKNHIINSRTNL